MTSWFDRAYQRVSSLNMGPVSSYGRRLSGKTLPQEVNNFKTMVNELSKDGSPEACISFYITHIHERPIKEIEDYAISSELSRLIRHLSHNLDDYLHDSLLLSKAFTFLVSAFKLYSSSPRTDTAVYRIILKVVQTNEVEAIEAACPFVQMVFSRNELLDFFFSGSQLSSIWTYIFLENDSACVSLGPMVTAAAASFVVKDNLSVQPFIDVVTNDMNEGKIDQNNASLALLFVGYIVRNINTGDFLPTIFPIICELAPFVDNLQFFEPLIIAPTSDQPAVWAALDAICFNPDLNIDLLQSALTVIYNSEVQPDPEVFSFNSFISRVVELNESYQNMLFEVLQNSRVETKADFLCWVMPLSQTGISTKSLFKKLVDGVKFGNLVENVILKILVEPEIDEVQLCLVSDEDFFNIANILLNQITSESENSKPLFERFTILISEGNEVILPLFKILLIKIDPKMYMENILEILKSSNSVSDDMMQIFCDVSLAVLSFNETFLKFNGVNLINEIVQTELGLNFLANIVVDGPYKEVDDYIYSNFHETALSTYDDKTLISLMMGMPQKSSKNGFLRIPSLCAYVKNVPLRTPYDQYIYASVATQYFTPTKEQMLNFAVRYVTREQAPFIISHPEFLPYVTDPLFPHYIVYQMHPQARCCSVGYQRNACCSFWFMVNELYGRTTLASFQGGSLDIESNGYITFGNRSMYCALKEWHLFSFVTFEKSASNQQQKIVAGYFDVKKMSEVNTTSIATIRLGHDDETYCNALWFISPFLHSSPIVLNQDEIQKIYNAGPHAPSQKVMNASKGVRLVPYHGILRFMHLFGGPYFIFNSMLEAKTKEDFMFFIQSAFNLYNLKIYKKKTFFSAIHYIMRRKIELFTPQVEQIILHELGKGENEFDWQSLENLMGDGVLLASSFVSSRFLTQIFQIHKVCENAIPFFHLLIDTFVFFTCDSEKSMISNTNFLKVAKIFLNYKPALLKKLMMVIPAIAFCDTDDVVLNLRDENAIEKQRVLLDFVMDRNEIELYTSQMTCSASFLFAIKLCDDLCIDFLEFISDICMKKSDYFDSGYLKKIVPHLFLLVENEKLWKVLFSFLFNKTAPTLEEYVTYEPIRPLIVPIIFDLLAHLIPYEISDNYNNNDNNDNNNSNNSNNNNDILYLENNKQQTEGIAFRVMHTIHSLVMMQSVHLFDIVGSVSNLCSLGFGERAHVPYPFHLSKKAPVQRRQSRASRLYRSSFDSMGDINNSGNSFGVQNLTDLDPTLFEQMQSHMAEHPVTLDQFADLELKAVDDPSDFRTIFEELSIIKLISKTAAKTLTEIGNDLNSFKKALTMLTIFGSDVLSEVAIEMHRKVILALFDERQRLSNDSFFYLVDFLTHRVIEGWWNGYIEQLFDKFIHEISGTTNKCIPLFIIACFSKIIDNEYLRNMTTSFLRCINPNVVSYCLSSQNFSQSLIYLVTTPEMLSDPLNMPTLYKEIGEKMENSNFSSYSNSVAKIKMYLAENPQISTTYLDYIKAIENNATTNSTLIMNERADISRKQRTTRILRYERSNITHFTYLRRAFRFEFFLRTNTELANVEYAVNKIFKAAIILKNCRETPTRFALSSTSHPLTAPIKQVPLLFPYESTYEKVSELPEIPKAVFQNKFNTKIPELLETHFGPKCLEGWELPGHNKAGITQLFIKIYKGSAELPPFTCNFLSSPEPLSCVGLISSSDNLVVLMNAKMSGKDNKNVELIEDNAQLCHYPLYEEAMQGLYGPSTLFIGHVVISIPFHLVTLVLPRTYLYKQTAVDIYTANGCHFTFVILEQSSRKLLLSKIKTIPNTTNRRGPGFSSRLLGKSLESITKFWTNNLMSNFDYLLYLNTMSGRSFNDFSQYPVFPWISADYESNKSNESNKSYESNESNKSNESNESNKSNKSNESSESNESNESNPSKTKLRDLSKSMGQQTHERTSKYDATYSDTDPHYYYGTHYSYPGAVLYYLVRSEPNTLYNVMLHKGFDHPDRVFISINETWKSASELNQADVKELIPQFFCFPAMFKNENKYCFPKRTDGIPIDNVILPFWGKDPISFVFQMRSLLESQEVSDQIPNWIDLVFGYKQRGEEAIKAKNVFHPLSYDDVIRSKENVESDDDVITNFGQCPSQLFMSPHPMRCHKEFVTLTTEQVLKITHLKKLSFNDNIGSLYVIDEEVKSLSRFSHYFGLPQKILTISDGILNIGGQCQYVEPVFDVTSSVVSSDGTILTITSGCGMVLNYYYCNNSFTTISRSLMPEVHFLTCAVSIHYSLVAASSEDHLYLFDLTSGFILRSIETSTTIVQLKFEEVHDYIIACEKNSIRILNLDFDLICESSTNDEITALTTSDSVIWFPKSFFITGHKSGSLTAWEVLVNLRSILEMRIAEPSSLPIVAATLFLGNKAVVCADADGNLSTVSVTTLMRRLLKQSMFETCPICNSKLFPSSTSFCNVCGVPFCKQCMVSCISSNLTSYSPSNSPTSTSSFSSSSIPVNSNTSNTSNTFNTSNTSNTTNTSNTSNTSDTTNTVNITFANLQQSHQHQSHHQSTYICRGCEVLGIKGEMKREMRSSLSSFKSDEVLLIDTCDAKTVDPPK